MGNIIRWALPDLNEVTYTHAYIYRSAGKAEVYDLLVTQLIADNTYFDVNGNNINWYKIAFRVGSSGAFSELSDPIQGGRFNGYCSIDDIRSFSSSLSSTKVSDSILFDLLKIANAQINQDILVEIRDEKISNISKDKENKIDGVNTVFYVAEPYLGDYNDDGLIDENDLFVYGVNTAGTRTTYVVSSIDDVRFGKFTLATAPPTGDILYVTYRTSPVLLYPSVHMMVRQAAINYVLALAYSRTDPGMVKSFRVNKISVTGESSPSKRYMQTYSNLVSKIVASPIKEMRGLGLVGE
jgi:hypothetical protein